MRPSRRPDATKTQRNERRLPHALSRIGVFPQDTRAGKEPIPALHRVTPIQLTHADLRHADGHVVLEAPLPLPHHHQEAPALRVVGGVAERLVVFGRPGVLGHARLPLLQALVTFP